MSRQHHDLKIETQYYNDIENGDKNFEIRKNDRNYQIGDMVYFKEVVNDVATGKELNGVEITYILHGGKYGLHTGYCIFEFN